MMPNSLIFSGHTVSYLLVDSVRVNVGICVPPDVDDPGQSDGHQGTRAVQEQAGVQQTQALGTDEDQPGWDFGGFSAASRNPGGGHYSQRVRGVLRRPGKALVPNSFRHLHHRRLSRPLRHPPRRQHHFLHDFDLAAQPEGGALGTGGPEWGQLCGDTGSQAAAKETAEAGQD